MLDTALILEGGGMRGVYTAGVLDFFMDKGLMFSPIYGVSAGACHGCSYLSGQRGRALSVNIDYLNDRRYASWYSLITTGDFFGVDFVYNTIPNQLMPYDYDTYNKSGAEFHVVVTNCQTGEAEYPVTGDMHKDIALIRASSSLPLLSRQVVIDKIPYLDGGISDSIPVNRARLDGHPRQVVVLTQHRGYIKPPNNMMSAIRLKYRRQPRLIESIRTRHERYNEALALIRREEQAGNFIVFAPNEPVTIGRLENDRVKLKALYQKGYDETAARFDELMAFLGRDPVSQPTPINNAKDST